MQTLRKLRRIAILFMLRVAGAQPTTSTASRPHILHVAAPAGGGRGWVPCRWSERTLSCEKGPPSECG